MTLETLQNEMIAAMKSGDKFRKTTISGLIAQIKKTAIDKGCRDNITEDMVNAELLKAKKITQEMIDSCPESRQDLLDDYKNQMKIVCEFAPSLMTDETEILNGVSSTYHELIRMTLCNLDRIDIQRNVTLFTVFKLSRQRVFHCHIHTNQWREVLG